MAPHRSASAAAALKWLDPRPTGLFLHRAPTAQVSVGAPPIASPLAAQASTPVRGYLGKRPLRATSTSALNPKLFTPSDSRDEQRGHRAWRPCRTRPRRHPPTAGEKTYNPTPFLRSAAECGPWHGRPSQCHCTAATARAAVGRGSTGRVRRTGGSKQPPCAPKLPPCPVAAPGGRAVRLARRTPSPRRLTRGRRFGTHGWPAASAAATHSAAATAIHSVAAAIHSAAAAIQ